MYMTVFGMPTSMFLVFVATILVGSMGAIHYVVVHVILGKPVDERIIDRDGGENDPTEDRATDGGSIDGRR